MATLKTMHPMQWAWYVDGGLDGIDPERIELLDGDVELGRGVAIVWTPGHTDGNHSLVINTPDGVWVSSENGVSSDNWQPELSRIPGVRQYSESYRREVSPMRTRLRTPSTSTTRWSRKRRLQTSRAGILSLKRGSLPSSELISSKRQWPVVPTHRHGGIEYGTITAN